MRPLLTSHELTIPGLSIGHGSDFVGKTGVTVLLCPEGAVAAAAVLFDMEGDTRTFAAPTT